MCQRSVRLGGHLGMRSVCFRGFGSRCIDSALSVGALPGSKLIDYSRAKNGFKIPRSTGVTIAGSCYPRRTAPQSFEIEVNRRFDRVRVCDFRTASIRCVSCDESFDFPQEVMLRLAGGSTFPAGASVRGRVDFQRPWACI